MIDEGLGQVDEFRARRNELGVGPTGASHVPISEGRIGTRSGWGKGTRLMPGR